MKNSIVTARFDAISTEGEQLTLKIAIKAPEPDPRSAGGDWRCKVKLAGLSDKTFIYGIDSLQALSLAIKFVETELRAFSDAGWQFYLPDCPDHPIDMSACYFPAL
ncbi:DUF6968 family protein [Aeromonas veronii]|uniref:DUF6968 family protein n=1 Tax=Aeromonas veronii TaxID=654 RepID=UPI0024159F3F|nr:hypothetical protein [Aeromonas veronii]WFO51850.1 hypothetical protein L1O00_02105 [Aeromonas veronii]